MLLEFLKAEPLEQIYSEHKKTLARRQRKLASTEKMAPFLYYHIMKAKLLVLALSIVACALQACVATAPIKAGKTGVKASSKIIKQAGKAALP